MRSAFARSAATARPAADKANWIRTLMAVTVHDLIAGLRETPELLGKGLAIDWTHSTG